jgi:hypothetical protein
MPRPRHAGPRGAMSWRDELIPPSSHRGAAPVWRRLARVGERGRGTSHRGGTVGASVPLEWSIRVPTCTPAGGVAPRGAAAARRRCARRALWGGAGEGDAHDGSARDVARDGERVLARLPERRGRPGRGGAALARAHRTARSGPWTPRHFHRAAARAGLGGGCARSRTLETAPTPISLRRCAGGDQGRGRRGGISDHAGDVVPPHTGDT